tara:strand:- start:51 stop:179 length:129 start_codon:yes stop_codon:yes gene_type:complete
LQPLLQPSVAAPLFKQGAQADQFEPVAALFCFEVLAKIADRE